MKLQAQYSVKGVYEDRYFCGLYLSSKFPYRERLFENAKSGAVKRCDGCVKEFGYR